MNKRQLLLNNINDLLVEFTLHIRQNNYSGKFDINKDAENIAINLLNLVYNYSLTNANNILSGNFPAVDLFDKEKRIVVQVTSTSDTEKLIYTIEKFIEKKLYIDYDNLYMYILTEKQDIYYKPTKEKIKNITNKVLKFDVKKNIIDNKDIGKEISRFTDIKHIEKIYDYLRDEFEYTIHSKKKYPKELNAFASYKVSELIGRGELLENINESFKKNNLVLIQGMGGIGKTAIAKGYIESYKESYSHIAYVEITTTLTEDLLKRLNNIDTSFKIDYLIDTVSNIYNLIDRLRIIEDTLLVIDNLNNEDDLRKYKGLLESFNWKILITTRALPQTYKSETIKVSHLSPVLAFSLFEKHYDNIIEDKNTVERILHKIRYHTKLTILLAKVALTNPFIRLEQMANKVNDGLYEDDALNVRISIDAEEYPIYEFILLLFDLEDLTIDQQKYLKYFSILPIQEISIQHLFELFENNQGQGSFINTLNKLVEKGVDRKI